MPPPDGKSRAGARVSPSTLPAGFAQCKRCEHDVLAIDGDAYLAGTLSLVPIDDYVPEPGDQFTILTTSGTVFDAFVDVQDLTEVILNWGACPDPPDPCRADTDGSGAVDVVDLVNVLLNWGT